MFEKASRMRLRFDFGNGLATTEDLWDMTLPNLDKIYRSLKAAAKKDDDESLLVTKTSADDILDLKIAVVKYIFTVKNDEKLAKATEAENRAHNKQIDMLIAQKQQEQLVGMSIEELEKLKK